MVPYRRKENIMKWALVVYFMTVSGWQSAETLGKDKIGWSSIVYETYQQCSSQARMFNTNRTTMFKEDPKYAKSVKAKCERVEK
jgi:hypothetical protein